MKAAAATLLFGAVLIVLSACNDGYKDGPDKPTSSNVTVKASPSKDDCPVVNGVDAVFADNAPSIIMIGEVHGYNGAPSLVKALLCQAAKRGVKVHLALEFSKDDEASAQRFIKSTGSQADYKAILSDSRWLNLGDGRHTEATFGLLEYLQVLSKDKKIGLSYFVPGAAEIRLLNQGHSFAKNYEIALANNLKNIFQQYGPDKMIVLVGNLHAQRTETKFGGETYLTMASYFTQSEAVRLNISRELDSQFSIILTPDEDGLYDGTVNVINDDTAPAVPSPFR